MISLPQISVIAFCLARLLLSPACHAGRLTSLETATVNGVAGSVAGGLAAGITTPFDVIKTQLQTTKNLGQSQTMLTSASRWAEPHQQYDILSSPSDALVECQWHGLTLKIWFAYPDCYQLLA